MLAEAATSSVPLAEGYVLPPRALVSYPQSANLDSTLKGLHPFESGLAITVGRISPSHRQKRKNPRNGVSLFWPLLLGRMALLLKMIVLWLSQKVRNKVSRT